MEGAQVTLCGFREVLSKYKREREKKTTGNHNQIQVQIQNGG